MKCNFRIIKNMQNVIFLLQDKKQHVLINMQNVTRKEKIWILTYTKQH